MYIVHPRVWNATRPDALREDVPVLRFRTAASMLRWALNTRQFAHHVGGVPYPSRFGDIYLGPPGSGSPGRDYHLLDVFRKYDVTADHLEAMRKAITRYESHICYRREIEPDWQIGPVTHYADNSTQRTDTCTPHNGAHTRLVRLAHPSGDACF